MLLCLLVALDFIAFEYALTDLDRERTVLRDIQICNLREDVAIRTVLLLNRLHILLQYTGIQQLTIF